MAYIAKRVTSNVKREQKSIKRTNYSSGVSTQDQIPTTNLPITRIQQNPEQLTPTDSLQLQRTIGNRAVSRLLPQAAQPTLLQTKSDVTDYLEEMKEAINKQQKLLEKIKSSSGAESGQQEDQTSSDQGAEQGPQQGAEQGPEVVSSTYSETPDPETNLTDSDTEEKTTGSAKDKNKAKLLAQQMMNPLKFAAAIKAGHLLGGKRPGRPPKHLRHLLKQMPGIKPGFPPGRRPPGFPPSPFAHMPEEMKFALGFKPGRRIGKKLRNRPRKHLKKLGKKLKFGF